jgi:hypothetical protein
MVHPSQNVRYLAKGSDGWGGDSRVSNSPLKTPGGTPFICAFQSYGANMDESPVDPEPPTKTVVKGLNQLSSYFIGYKLTPKCKFIHINLHHTSLLKTYCRGDRFSTYSGTLFLWVPDKGITQ